MNISEDTIKIIIRTVVVTILVLALSRECITIVTEWWEQKQEIKHLLRCFETGDKESCCWLKKNNVGQLAEIKCIN